MSVIIGKGASGCVYHPALNCRGDVDPDPTNVTKLMRLKSAWEEERAQSAASRDPTAKFTVPALEACEVPIPELPEETKHVVGACKGVVADDSDTAYLMRY